MKHNTFIKTLLYSGSLLAVTNILVGGLNYLFNVLVGRALGPEDFGEVATFISYFTFFSIPGTVLTNIVIQRLGKNQKTPHAYARAVEQWLLTIIRNHGWYIIPLSIVFIPFMPTITNVAPLGAYLIIPIGIISIFVSLYSGFLQGLNLILYFCISLFAATVIKLGGGILTYLSVISLSGIFVILTIAPIIALVIVVGTSRYFIAQRIETKPMRIARPITQLFRSRSLFIMSLSLVSMIALNAIDIMLAKRVLDATQAGIYSAWSLIAKIPLYFMSPILMASYIMFTKKNTTTPRYVHAGFLFILMVFTMTVVATYHMLREFIPVLIFGEGYIQLYLYMEYAGLFGSLLMFITYCNNYLLAQTHSATLILPVALIIYVGAFFVTVQSIMHIMIINTLFVVIVATIYTLTYIKAVRDSYQTHTEEKSPYERIR